MGTKLSAENVDHKGPSIEQSLDSTYGGIIDTVLFEHLLFTKTERIAILALSPSNKKTIILLKRPILSFVITVYQRDIFRPKLMV